MRVAFVAVCIAALSLIMVSQEPAALPIPPIDHLVYAVPDLDRGIAEVESLTGVRATPGGSHPGRGTRNALIALGPDSYLEIIGPDPAQNIPAAYFGIDKLTKPKLVSWALKNGDLAGLRHRAAAKGVQLEPVSAGSRKRPDGVALSWKTTGLAGESPDLVVPFFIDWGASPHPAKTAAPSLKLASFRAEHPEPQRVQESLHALGVDLEVTQGPAAALVAIIEGPKGRVELR